MLRVTVRGAGFAAVTLGSGETLRFGRRPALPPADHRTQLRHHALHLPRCAPHVSRLLGELVVGDEVVRLRWRGAAGAQLSSLFGAPGEARRVTLTAGMAALLDEDENHLVILRGREGGPERYADLGLSILVDEVPAADRDPDPADHDPTGTAARTDDTGHGGPVESDDPTVRDGAPTGPAPTLAPGSREWYVALALAEPWLNGTDDYPPG